MASIFPIYACRNVLFVTAQDDEGRPFHAKPNVKLLCDINFEDTRIEIEINV